MLGNYLHNYLGLKKEFRYSYLSPCADIAICAGALWKAGREVAQTIAAVALSVFFTRALSVAIGMQICNKYYTDTHIHSPDSYDHRLLATDKLLPTAIIWGLLSGQTPRILYSITSVCVATLFKGLLGDPVPLKWIVVACWTISITSPLIARCWDWFKPITQVRSNHYFKVPNNQQINWKRCDGYHFRSNMIFLTLWGTFMIGIVIIRAYSKWKKAQKQPGKITQ